MMNTIIDFIYSTSLLFSLVMSFIYRKDLRSRNLGVLLPFLIYTFAQEMLLDLAVDFPSAILYNIYRPISAIVFSFIYYRVPFLASLKKLIAGLTIAYLCVVVATYCFIDSIFVNSTYLTLARGFMVTFCSILFLFRYFSLDNLKEEKFWRPLVLITAGIAIFYPVVTLSLTFEDYLATQDATLFGFKLYQVIPQLMSIFMYCCFSYAFYLCRKIK